MEMRQAGPNRPGARPEAPRAPSEKRRDYVGNGQDEAPVAY
jgi:hypothetical protein